MMVVFIGYELGSKAYRCYDPVCRCVVISHDVIFDEAVAWRWCDINGEQQDTGEPFMLEYSTELVRDVVPATPTLTPSPMPPPMGEHVVSTTKIDDDDMDAEHDDAPLWLHPIDGIIGDAVPSGLVHRVFNVELNFTSADELATFCEVEHEEPWCQTMIDEMKSIEDNTT
jgi:hypothetical protein